MKDKKDRIIKLDGEEINLSKLSNEDVIKVAWRWLENEIEEKKRKAKELKEEVEKIEKSEDDGREI